MKSPENSKMLFLGIVSRYVSFTAESVTSPNKVTPRIDSTNMCWCDSQADHSALAWGYLHLSLTHWVCDLELLNSPASASSSVNVDHNLPFTGGMLEPQNYACEDIKYFYIRNHHPSEIFVNEPVNQFCDLKLNWVPLIKEQIANHAGDAGFSCPNTQDIKVSSCIKCHLGWFRLRSPGLTLSGDGTAGSPRVILGREGEV